MAAVLVFQVAYAGPAAGADPGIAPAASPAPTEPPVPVADGTPEPSPSLAPAPTPGPTVPPPAGGTATEPPITGPQGGAQDALPPLPAGAVEIVAERDAYSRVYRDAKGRLSREIFPDPVFYEPGGDTGFVPIEAGFTPVAGTDKAVVSAKAPAAVTVPGPTVEPCVRFRTVGKSDPYRTSACAS
jgi:hypothetical protein